jgi:glycosyltransferase involved in cell wall biosynthesis
MATLKTSTAHNHLIHVFGEEGALVKMKECGFDGVDFSFDHWQLDYDYFLLQDEDTLKKFCARQKEVCDRIGLAVAHTHAPYYFCDPKHYDTHVFVERFINAIKATKYLGSNLIVIHPTYYPEGMSNVLLESAASGRAIISTDRAGCREAIDDGINGYIIREKDSADLIDKVEKFINLSYEEKKNMGLCGREKVAREFDRNIVVNRYLETVAELTK